MSSRKKISVTFERGDHIDYILDEVVGMINNYVKDDTKGEGRATTSFMVSITYLHTKREKEDGTSTTSFAKHDHT